jgi:hypothetical protein
MRKEIKQNDLGKRNTVIKREYMGGQKNEDDFLIRQTLRGGNVNE